MPTARMDFRNRRLASLALAGLFAVATTLSLRAAVDRFDELLHGDRYVDTSFGIGTQTLKVDALDPAAERAGLRKGDVAVSINGRPVQGWSDIYGPVLPAGDGLRDRGPSRDGCAGGAAPRLHICWQPAESAFCR